MICHQNRRINENFIWRPKISSKFYSPKIPICRSEKHLWPLAFHIVFVVIFFLKSAHQLLPLDYEKRVHFAQWWVGLHNDSHKWLFATDEAYFSLTDLINKQNNRLWLTERPEDWIERPLHDAKVLVWCAISSRKIYGPFFFETTVNQHNYTNMFNFFLAKALQS